MPMSFDFAATLPHALLTPPCHVATIVMDYAAIASATYMIYVMFCFTRCCRFFMRAYDAYTRRICFIAFSLMPYCLLYAASC